MLSSKEYWEIHNNIHLVDLVHLFISSLFVFIFMLNQFILHAPPSPNSYFMKNEEALGLTEARMQALRYTERSQWLIWFPSHFVLPDWSSFHQSPIEDEKSVAAEGAETQEETT